MDSFLSLTSKAHGSSGTDDRFPRRWYVPFRSRTEHFCHGHILFLLVYCEYGFMGENSREWKANELTLLLFVFCRMRQPPRPPAARHASALGRGLRNRSTVCLPAMQHQGPSPTCSSWMLTLCTLQVARGCVVGSMYAISTVEIHD